MRLEPESCDVIRDLLPAYADGICSEDTAHLVEAHMAHCDGCAAALSAMQAALPATPAEVEAEQKASAPLRRVATRWRRRTVIAVVTTLLLVFVVFPLYYLTYCQLEGDGVDFECIAAYFQARRAFSAMAEEDFTRMAEEIGFYGLRDETGTPQRETAPQEKAAFIQGLEAFFAVDGRSVLGFSDLSFLSEDGIPLGQVTLEVSDGADRRYRIFLRMDWRDGKLYPIETYISSAYDEQAQAFSAELGTLLRTYYAG